jgi:hypothetical protein
MVLSNLGRFDDAEKAARRVVDVTEYRLGTLNYLTGLAWQYVAAVQQAQGHFAQALDSEQHAYAAADGGHKRARAGIEGTLGSLEYLLGDPTRAVQHLRTAERRFMDLGGPDNPFTQLTDFYLAAALVDTGHPAEARTLAVRLHPEALAAADATSHWKARLDALVGKILIRSGRAPQGNPMVRQAFASLSHDGAPDWLLAQVSRDLPSGDAGAQRRPAVDLAPLSLPAPFATGRPGSPRVGLPALAPHEAHLR